MKSWNQRIGPALKICGLSILLILTLSVVGFATNSAFGSSASTCSDTVINQKIMDAQVPVTQSDARSFAESSAQYGAAVSGFTSYFDGAATQWNIDSDNCTVSFNSFAMNYYLKAANGSFYVLTMGADPRAASIWGVSIQPMIVRGLPIAQSSETYSGYLVATDSSYNQLVNYTTANWYVPSLQEPGSPGCGLSTTVSPPQCEFDVWTGLQSSLYDGINRVNGTGEVIQVGTEGICRTSTCTYGSVVNSTWSEFVAGTSSGVTQAGYMGCDLPLGSSASAGDQMNGVVGNEYAINGTRGAGFLPVYAIIHDRNHVSGGCKINWSDSSSCVVEGVPSTCTISGKEYLAGYFVETPQKGSGSFPLAKFSVPHGEDLFYSLGMSTTSQGTYTYYNDGYYLKSWMENGGTNNTSVTPMSEIGGGGYGYFNETWLSSANT
jgi:hypothetical protein